MTEYKKTTMLDITAPDHGVNVSWSEGGKVLWVNVDGMCVLRVCRIPALIINGRSNANTRRSPSVHSQG